LALSNKKNRIELLREFESIFKISLAHESGDPGVPFNEKTKDRKSHENVPLISIQPRPAFTSYTRGSEKYDPSQLIGQKIFESVGGPLLKG
jgi:hypothetical protein